LTCFRVLHERLDSLAYIEGFGFQIDGLAVVTRSVIFAPIRVALALVVRTLPVLLPPDRLLYDLAGVLNYQIREDRVE
jgi:hypothetical protein